MFDDFTTLFKVTWSGTLGASEEEIFSYGRWLVGGDLATTATVAAALATDITDLLAEATTGDSDAETIAGYFTTDVAWTNMAVWSYDEVTGLWNPDQERVDVPLTDAGVSSGVPGLPYQDSMCITLRTAARGRRERNRFYLPPMAAFTTNGHSQWVGTVIDDIQTQLKFQQNAHATDDNLAFCIYSPADHLAKKIDNYYTGSVVDTIRRRRNRLVETRHVLSDS